MPETDVDMSDPQAYGEKYGYGVMYNYETNELGGERRSGRRADRGSQQRVHDGPQPVGPGGLQRRPVRRPEHLGAVR